ncbi:uncharacterized protein KIAA0408 isoform X5 [Takifugu rubripes]|uniref:MTCL family member 3a n=1 Tax=Takifugu rubripes TaxID=31033 RepID=A0A3B5K0U6_TAKRU|nr:uncharacterized protein KIAA0408 isoform X5 [Takifugu rubripes]
MVGWFTSHDIASCEGGRKGVRGRDRGRHRERERERERERGLQLWAAALGCAAFQSRLHLSRAINASLEDEGGENRRILLDMKTVLEEVQLEVKREEEKRSELQLQYTRDKCSWELEKAELKRRIAQLEARERTGLIVGGGQLAPCAQEKLGETPTLRREREEQRRLLEDTRSTAMDLRCRLDLSERDWSREKAELLERFDVERREWESQLRDMQKKIEELYCEVRAKREGTSRKQNLDVTNQLSIRSTSTGSSSLSGNSPSEPSSGSSRSGTARITSLPGFSHSRNVGAVDGGGHPTCFQEDHLSQYINAGGQKEHSHHELIELSSLEPWQQLSVTETTDLGGLSHAAPGYCMDLTICSSNSSETDSDGVSQSSPRSEPSYGNEKKRNTTALNAALKEIARVSKELCSYQDEIRKKSGDRRNQFEALCLQEDNDNHVKTVLEVDDALCDFSQIYNDCVELEQERWLTLSSENTWQADRSSSTGTPGNLTELDEAPPVPPRTSSWNLSTTAQPDTELHIPESPLPTMRKCHSPCSLLDRKCSSPSIVRKFGAMLQENEGKILIDGVVASCSVPANTKCNIGCCHNRWSCDASKLSDRKAVDVHVQKSFSEVNVLTAHKDLHSGCGSGGLKGAQLPPSVKDLPLDLLLSSLEISPASLQKQDSKRNITLEQKTAEFNRTLFQAEMGRGVEEQDSLAVMDARPAGCQHSDEVLPPRETKVLPGPANATAVNSEAAPLLSASDSTGHDGGNGPDIVCTNLSCEQPPIVFREASAVPCPGDSPEVKPVRAASSPLRKPRHKAATEALFSSENIQPGQNEDTSSSKSKSPSEAKPLAARGGVSPLQPSADGQQRQMTQPKHLSTPPSQSDSARPAPRMLNDHPWKPLTLAAYPRPEGSRSNYGALERILKNYESAARAQENQSQLREASSSPNASIKKGETITELGMLDVEPLALPLTLKHTHVQLSSYSSVCGTVQANKEASSALKNFLRPARPAKRRLPSRWARVSLTSSDSTSSSPSTTPAPPLFPLHAHGSTFLSRSLQMETVII